MKILIWVLKQDLIDGNIKEYHTHFENLPQSGGGDYVQVEITKDEFVKLEDEKTDHSNDEWRVNQYNRNRKYEDHITSIDDMDQNNQAFGD